MKNDTQNRDEKKATDVQSVERRVCRPVSNVFVWWQQGKEGRTSIKLSRSNTLPGTKGMSVYCSHAGNARIAKTQ